MKRQRTVKRYTMQLNAGADEVFPLLCPVREYEWIQPWKCEIVYSDSGRAELDCVFKTNFPDDGPEDTWVVSRYEPPKYIEFVRTNQLRSIRYFISIIQQDEDHSQAIWQQVLTGLDSDGDQFVADYKDEAYNDEMSLLENMLNYFLRTGEMMKIM